MSACGSKSWKSESSEDGAYSSVTLGDGIFMKLRGSSWWPAQVGEFSCLLVFIVIVKIPENHIKMKVWKITSIPAKLIENIRRNIKRNHVFNLKAKTINTSIFFPKN